MSSSVAETAPVVFVVDDDVSMRESLELLFRSVSLETALFASAQEFLAYQRALGPGCIVLDVSLPDGNGLDIQKLICSDRGSMPVIFITGHGDVPTSVKAMKAGAVEFLLKPFQGEILLQAVEEAIEHSRSALATTAEMSLLEDRHATLTRRERDVFERVVKGLLNKQIAAELGIREITVKGHRRCVMQKMHARSLADLVRIAGKLRLQAQPR